MSTSSAVASAVVGENESAEETSRTPKKLELASAGQRGQSDADGRHQTHEIETASSLAGVKVSTWKTRPMASVKKPLIEARIVLS
jgi:hypothetical protein